MIPTSYKEPSSAFGIRNICNPLIDSKPITGYVDCATINRNSYAPYACYI